MLQRFFRIHTTSWYMLVGILPIMLAGLFTVNTFDGQGDRFIKQGFFVLLSLGVFFLFSSFDYRLLRRSDIVSYLYGGSLVLLALLFPFGQTIKGARSWFDLGVISFQPSDVAKIVLIIVLAKYFTRRHVEIAQFKHILVSGVYALIPFGLILLQPDFGNAIVIFFIWLGMVFVSGISKKHVAIVFGIGAVAVLLMWTFVFAQYQKDRIANFFNPLADVRGSGYNANQALIAVGSGQILGKGLGYGTQSRLNFLPEYQTDFVFAAFAEEWGFLGVLVLLISIAVVMSQLLRAALLGATNFETLFALGVAVFFGIHFVVNIGMNMGIMPVTGITLPFMSYGGSHLLVECAALGMVVGMSRYRRVVHRSGMNNEFLGLE
jgi:rod shape determining protein RodA